MENSHRGNILFREHRIRERVIVPTNQEERELQGGCASRAMQITILFSFVPGTDPHFAFPFRRAELTLHNPRRRVNTLVLARYSHDRQSLTNSRARRQTSYSVDYCLRPRRRLDPLLRARRFLSSSGTLSLSLSLSRPFTLSTQWQC